MDQSNPGPGVMSLPLYVATCRYTVCFETPDYERRAWCMVERLVAYAFQTGGASPFVIDGAFDDSGRGARPAYVARLLRDPSRGELTVEADRAAIDALVAIVRGSRAWRSGSRAIDFGRTQLQVQSFSKGAKGQAALDSS